MGSDGGGGDRSSSVPPPASLPTSSPPGALSDGSEIEERSVVSDEVTDLEEEDDEGEDLFDDTMVAYVF